MEKPDWFDYSGTLFRKGGGWKRENENFAWRVWRSAGPSTSSSRAPQSVCLEEMSSESAWKIVKVLEFWLNMWNVQSYCRIVILGTAFRNVENRIHFWNNIHFANIPGSCAPVPKSLKLPPKRSSSVIRILLIHEFSEAFHTWNLTCFDVQWSQ